MADYTTNHRRSLRYATDEEGNRRPTLATVERLDKFFAGMRVSQIDTTMMKKFAAFLQSEGLSNGSINRSLSALRRMFHLAMEEQRLRFIPYFPMLEEAAPRKGFFERDEYQKLYAALPEYLRPVLAIGYYTGMRRAEITGLTWEQVDLLNRVIHLNSGETKNGEGRDVEITSELYAVLTAQHAKRVSGCRLVCFRATKNGKTIAIGDFRKIWYARCVKLGLGEMKQATDPATGAPLWEAEQGSESERKPRLVYVGRIFHDLRRTGVRNLVRAGVPERIAMRITGHKTRSVFERYNIVSARDLEEAGRKLDAYHSQKNGSSLVQTEPKGRVGQIRSKLIQ
jgi:integrase